MLAIVAPTKGVGTTIKNISVCSIRSVILSVAFKVSGNRTPCSETAYSERFS